MLGNIPIWYWRTRVRKYGARMSKAPVSPDSWSRVVLPIVDNRRQFGHSASGSTPMGLVLARREEKVKEESPLKKLVGNIGLSEYQFWVGSPAENSKEFKCRNCEASVYGGVKERRAHMNQGIIGQPCSVRTLKVIQLLCIDSKCVVCHKATSNRRWGMPICHESNCYAKWMFGKKSLHAWDAARDLAKSRGQFRA